MQMHYTGTIWRPPYESNSLLLQVSAGCTHHKCKFCTLYEDIPFKFKISPLVEIESDLKEAQAYYTKIKRVFLTGANPFVLSFNKLKSISELIKYYFPTVESIGCFARITDIIPKTDEQLVKLHEVGYDLITIGVECGDDTALNFMNKGYDSNTIIKQCIRLDSAKLKYNFFYLAGIYGADKWYSGVNNSANVFNCTNPKIIVSSMLTVSKNSSLYKDILNKNFIEESEIVKFKELKLLIEKLKIHVYFATMGASNYIFFDGFLQKDKNILLNRLNTIINNTNEKEVRMYREALQHL